MMNIVLSGDNLKIEDVVSVAHNDEIVVSIDERAKDKILASRAFVDEAVDSGKVIYGLTTGFGYFKNVTIDKSKTEELQENIIMSHAVGVGNVLSYPTVRAMMLVRANSLIKGYSGVRLVVIETLIDCINKGVYPFIPEIGSLGASGDLAPLAHMSLVLIGQGEAFVNEKKISGSAALANAGITPLRLSSKEGLALTNGTALMAGLGCLNLHRAEQLTKIADIAGAMSLEAMMGSIVPFDSEVHEIRPHVGQQVCAKNFRRLCYESQIIHSHEHCDRVQDSYSIRCIPQVHGAVRDTVAHVRKTLEIEINSATDNPLIFAEEKIARSAGNFHGEPIALNMDFLSIAIAELASISERRIAKAVDKNHNEGLPAFLIPEEHAGLSSGFMIMQYTAASLVSENKTLAHPDSVDSIPTSANQEDHVSMGASATRHTRDIIDHVEQVLAIELMTAAQALDFRKPLLAGSGVLAAHNYIRKHISFVDKDRVMYKDIYFLTQKIQQEELLDVVEAEIGKLA
jgi:histidine ammonia-lyase